jgi:hypothetical protein
MPETDKKLKSLSTNKLHNPPKQSTFNYSVEKNTSVKLFNEELTVSSKGMK